MLLRKIEQRDGIGNQKKKWVKFGRGNPANILRKNKRRNNEGKIDQRIE
jgi:hypothetical protein